MSRCVLRGTTSSIGLKTPSTAGDAGPSRSNDSGGRRPPRRNRGAIDCLLASLRSEVLDLRGKADTSRDVEFAAVIEYHICDELGRSIVVVPEGASSAFDIELKEEEPARRFAIQAVRSNARAGLAVSVVLDPVATEVSVGLSSSAMAVVRLRSAERRRDVKEANSLDSAARELNERRIVDCRDRDEEAGPLSPVHALEEDVGSGLSNNQDPVDKDSCGWISSVVPSAEFETESWTEVEYASKRLVFM